MDLNEIRDYVESINLSDFDLAGVEITDDDYETIKSRIEDGESLEGAVHMYLLEIREVLDQGLDNE